MRPCNLSPFALVVLLGGISLPADAADPKPLDGANPAVLSEGPPAGVPTLPPPSTAPVSVAHTGETISAQPPRAMTDSSEDRQLVTLTRSALPREKWPSDVEMISSAEISAMHARHAGDVISTLAGARIDRFGELGAAQKIHLRGSTPEQVLVLIDGRPMAGTGNIRSQNLSEIAVQQIDRIEIVRGNLASLYGPAAASGVINILSKRASHVGLPISHVGFENRSDAGQAYNLDFGTRYGPVDFFFYGNRGRDRGFRRNEDSRTYHLGGNVGWALGAVGRVLLDVSSYHLDGGTPGPLIPEVPPSLYDGTTERRTTNAAARQDVTSDAFRMSYLFPFGEKSLLRFRLFGSKRETEFRNDEILAHHERQEQSKGAEIDVDLPAGLLVGANFQSDRLDFQNRAAPALSRTEVVENTGIFIQETGTWRRLTVIPSARFHQNSQSGASLFSRLQSVFDVTEIWRLSASLAHSVRSPSLEEAFSPLAMRETGVAFQGNVALRQEKSMTQSAGVEWHPSSASVSVNLFRSQYSDFIQTTAGTVETPVNVDHVRRQGVEVDGRRVWNDRFSDRWNYSWTESRGRPAGFSDDVLLRLSPKHTAYYELQWKFKKRQIWSHSARWIGDYFEGNNRSAEKISGRVTWNTRFQFSIRQLDFFVGAENVLDKRYRDRSGFPLAGRTFFGGMELRLWG